MGVAIIYPKAALHGLAQIQVPPWLDYDERAHLMCDCASIILGAIDTGLPKWRTGDRGGIENHERGSRIDLRMQNYPDRPLNLAFAKTKMSDLRLSRLRTDPRFRKPKNKENKVAVDEYSQAMS